MLPVLVPGSFLIRQEHVPEIWGDTNHVYQHVSIGSDFVTAENLAGLQAEAIEVFGPGENDNLRIDLPSFSIQKEQEEKKEEKKGLKKKKSVGSHVWKGLRGFYAIGTQVDKGLVKELATLPCLQAITELMPGDDWSLCDNPTIFTNCKRLELCGKTSAAKVIQILKKCQDSLEQFVYHYAGRSMDELWVQWTQIAQQLCQSHVSRVHLHIVPCEKMMQAIPEWQGLYLLYKMPYLHHLVVSNDNSLVRVDVPRLPRLLSLQVTGLGPYSFLFQKPAEAKDLYFHLRIPSHLLSISTAMTLRDRVAALELIDNPIPSFDIDVMVSWIRPNRRLISVPPPDPMLSHEEVTPIQFQASEETQLVVTCQWPWTAICRHFTCEDMKGGRVYAPYVEWDDRNQENECGLLRFVRPSFLMVKAPLPQLTLPSVQEVVYLQQPITARQMFKSFPNLRKLYVRQNQWHLSQLTRMRQHCMVTECL